MLKKSISPSSDEGCIESGKPVRPMLAAPVSIEQIKYPCFASPKLDGIRGLLLQAKTLSRTLKVIPNRYVRDRYAEMAHHGLDGEFIVGPPNAPDTYRRTVSALMSYEGEPEAMFYAFDDISIPKRCFVDRLQSVKDKVAGLDPKMFSVLDQMLINNITELVDLESMWVNAGFEGLVTRHPMGHYKYGRSTLSQGWMLKLKRFLDSEARILDFVELKVNNNAATINVLGYMERSHHQENKVGGQKLGAFVVEDLYQGWQFEIGTGFMEEERRRFWKQKKTLLGRTIKYKYFPIGMKDVPRHPVYLGFRDPIDM